MKVVEIIDPEFNILTHSQPKYLHEKWNIWTLPFLFYDPVRVETNHFKSSKLDRYGKCSLEVGEGGKIKNPCLS